MLVGSFRSDQSSAEVTGPGGSVRFVFDSPASPASAQSVQVARLLTALDGTRSVADLIRLVAGLDVDPILDALVHAQVLFDARELWRVQALVAANPSLLPSPMSVEEAYSRPSFMPPVGMHAAPPGRTDAALCLGAASALRRSIQLDQPVAWDPELSLSYAYRAALDTLEVRPDGQRVVASAGGLRPLQAAVVVSAGAGWESRLVDHEGGTFGVPTKVDDSDVRRALLADESWSLGALRRGAALVIIAGDPTRTCGKYGNRGWQYMHEEAGAVAHHIALLFAGQGGGTRFLGGFADEATARLLCAHRLWPLLCVITVPPEAPDHG